MSLRNLIKSISKREWAVVGIVSVVVIALTAIPPLFGYLIGASRGLEWTGLQVFAPGDFGVYLSYIEQGRAGSPFMENFFTTAPTVPVFNILWFSVGQLAWMFSLSAIAAFHVARSLLIPALLVVTYVATAYFLPKARDRIAAFLMMAFGSGLGLYFAPLFAGMKPTLTGHEWPIDLWVAEANIFASMSYSPHFVASWSLFIIAALMLVMAFDNCRMRYAAVAGAAALVLFSFHPFHAPTLFALGLVYLVVRRNFRGKEALRRWAVYVIFVAISAPAVLYHYFITTFDTFAKEALAANTCITPAPWHFIIGFGAFALLAPAGVVLLRSKRAEFHHARFLIVWVVVCLALVYSPLTFQRRLLEGLQFPLAIMAAPVALAVIRWGKKRLPVSELFLAAALFFVFLFPSSFAVITRNVTMYSENRPPIFYLSPDRSAALGWIRDNTAPDAAFMSDFSSGYNIAGWAYRTVYVGHWVNSGDIKAKMEDARRFFGEMDEGEKAKFMLGNRLDYIFVGPDERELGGFVEGDMFELLYSEGKIDVFRLK
ncbi:MAG: hypothetical protein U9Q03_03300 [Patescibacteria group bacterium]|nr:hypothetical protein [Patescibacteria group bacterium]